MLTWGRTDDASLFVDSDLSFALVLFRLAISWWSALVGCLGILLQSARRFVNQSGESGKRAEINKFVKGRSALPNLVPSSTSTPQKWFLPFAPPSKRFRLFVSSICAPCLLNLLHIN